jgi:glycosyltransferase involved in cell wall biosynthesis
MKILLVHNYYRSGSPGGEDVVFEQERALLSAAGHQVVSYTRCNDEMREGNPIDSLRVLAGLRRSRRTRSELSALIMREKPDVAHVHNTFPLISPGVFEVCAAAGLPVVQTVHNYRMVCAAANHYRDGGVCEKCTIGKPWAAVGHSCYRGSRLASLAVAQSLWRQARDRVHQGQVARYIALTEFAARRLRAAGVSADRVIVKPNFIDTSMLPMPAPSVEAPYAVFTGRLSAEKGVKTLLAAWREVPSLRLKIVGDGPLREALHREAEARQLPIDFLGTLPRVEALAIVRDSLCQIVPSQWFEGMPMVVLEAWALGVPVIASRIGGLAEMLGEDERGLGFRPGDIGALVAAVHRLRSNSQLASELIERAREALAQHRPAATLAQLEQIYRGVMK